VKSVISAAMAATLIASAPFPNPPRLLASLPSPSLQAFRNTVSGSKAIDSRSKGQLVAAPLLTEAPCHAENACMRVSAFIEPCLPSPADRPPSGADWIHEKGRSRDWLKLKNPNAPAVKREAR
jgi:hypothetical protein